MWGRKLEIYDKILLKFDGNKNSQVDSKIGDGKHLPYQDLWYDKEIFCSTNMFIYKNVCTENTLPDM